MSQPFRRSLAILNEDLRRDGRIGLALLVLTFSAWVAWLFLADVSLYEQSSDARLDSGRDLYTVGMPEDGTIVATHLALGKRFRRGQVLVEVEDTKDRLALEEAARELDQLTRMIEPMRTERGALEAAVVARKRVLEAEIREVQARHLEEDRRRALLRRRAERAEELRKRQLISDDEVEELAADSAAADQRAGALGLRVDTLRQEDRAGDAEADRALASLEREIAELEGRAAVQGERIAQLRWQRERRLLRAPFDGVVASAAAVGPGTVAERGTVLGTFLPERPLQVRARFPKRALGKIREGQRARVRLAAYPWMRYGSLPATVSEVAAYTSAEDFDVVLSPGASQLSIGHGMTGVAEVEVARVRPIDLILQRISSAG